MGWLRKTFKKIGKGIKKAFMKFGKFMGKIGVLGQVAMLFILPGIGAALMKGVTGAFGAIVGQTGAQAAAAASTAVTAGTATAAQTALAGTVAAGSAAGATAAQVAASTAAQAAAATGMAGSANALVAGAGKVLQYAGKAASIPGKVFKSVTSAVTNTLGEFSKTALQKIPGVKNLEFVKNLDAADNFFSSGVTGTAGETSAFGRVGQAIKAPFSETARASITARQELFKNQQKTLLDAVSKVEVPSVEGSISSEKVIPDVSSEIKNYTDQFPTDQFPEVKTKPYENIKVGSTDSILSKPVSSNVDSFGDMLEGFKTTDVTGELVPIQSQSTGQIMYAPEGTLEAFKSDPSAYSSATGGLDVSDLVAKPYAKDPLSVTQQFGKDIAAIGTDAKDVVTGKLSNLADPAKAIPALAKTAVGSYQDAQYAARANERAPEVIDLGQSQDFRDFQAADQGFFQNSAIGPYQLQNANTYTPQSSWAQQQMLMLQQQQQQGVYS